MTPAQSQSNNIIYSHLALLAKDPVFVLVHGLSIANLTTSFLLLHYHQLLRRVLCQRPFGSTHDELPFFFLVAVESVCLRFAPEPFDTVADETATLRLGCADSRPAETGVPTDSPSMPRKSGRSNNQRTVRRCSYANCAGHAGELGLPSSREPQAARILAFRQATVAF